MLAYQKKPLILSLCVILSAIAIAGTLAWLTASPVHTRNGFTRQLSNTSIATLNIIAKNKNVTRVCGAGEAHLYFQTEDPGRLLVTDRQLQHPKILGLKTPRDERTLSHFIYEVDSPRACLMAGNVPAIMTGDLDSSKMTPYRFPASLFTRSVPISSHSFVLRGFDTTVHTADQIFLKGDPQQGVLQREDHISEKRGDGGISTDGYLHYDSLTHLLCYIFSYRNQFLCLDTNLHLIYKGHTIDTISHFHIQAGAISSSSRSFMLTNTSPSLMVNHASCVAGGKLFVRSGLKADNEKDGDFKRNAVIDIYQMQDGNYQGSFYIPNCKGEPLQQFRIYGNLIVAMYDDYIATYRLGS